MLQIKKLYNIMSLALRKVEDCTKERDYERLRNIEEDYETAILEELKKRFPDMFDRETRNVAEVSELRLVKSSLVKDLEKYLAVSENIEELIFLVKCLDLFLEDTVYGCIPVDQEQYHFHCLNDNYSECRICLLPRIKCGWEHQNREAYTSYSIHYYLRNFYYVCEKDAGDYEVQHILMPKDLFRAALQRRELKVMVSPAIGENVVEMTEPYIRDHARFVSIKPMKPDAEERMQAVLLNVLKEADFGEADLLLFPEMLGTEGLTECLSDELDARERISNNGFPRLTMCPTVWQQHCNYCRILDDLGETICEQQKHYGAELKQGRTREGRVKEDIKSDRKIYILHCHGIGRIAVAICKDFLMTSYLKILVEQLEVSLLLVPSFTGGDYQFKALASKYGIKDCNVIWVNACSARWLDGSGELKTSVTLAYLPGKGGNLNIEQREISDFCKGQYKCDGTCVYTYRLALDAEVRG